MEIRNYGRYFAVYEKDELVCVCLYKKGATEVVRRLKEKGDEKYGRHLEEKEGGYC